MKKKERIQRALEVAEFWQPYLVDFAKRARVKDEPYEHPWLPAAVVEKIIVLLTDDESRSYYGKK